MDLTEDDLVFITNGGCVENSSMGSQNTPAPYNTEIKPGGGWDMWRKIAAQDPAFGNPDKFCYDPEQTNWMSATVEIPQQLDAPGKLPLGADVKFHVDHFGVVVESPTSLTTKC